MELNLEEIKKISENVGFCGYGEETGVFIIPINAFYLRLQMFAQYLIENYKIMENDCE